MLNRSVKPFSYCQTVIMGYLVRKNKKYTGGNYISTSSSTLANAAARSTNNYTRKGNLYGLKSNSNPTDSAGLVKAGIAFSNSKHVKQNRLRYIMSQGN